MKYDVHHNVGMSTIIITRNGEAPRNGQSGEVVGSFDMNVDPDNNTTTADELGNAHSNDHPFIAKAREILDEAGINSKNLTFLDQASNAPIHGEGVATDDLPRVEEGSDPEFSNQAGGEGSTADTDPKSTAPNGVQDKQEGEQTKEDAPKEADDKETVAQLKERIAKVTDKDELQKIYDTEVAGQDRAGAKAAIEARAVELQDA